MKKAKMEIRGARARHSADRGIVFAVAAAISLLGAPAFAQDNADQDVSPNKSVSERFTENFAVDGIRSGSFIFFPVLTYAQIYDDNIFSAPADETDDFIADINATLTLQSDWDMHGVDLLSTVRRLQYFDNTSESTTDYGVLGRGVFDLSRRSTATITGGYARSTEARRSTQTAFGAEPVRFDVARAAIDFDLRQTRLREQFGVSYRQDNFDDVASPVGPGVIDQDFRDRDVFAGYFRQSFRVRPTVSLFAEVNGEIQQFDSNQLAVGGSQESESYGAGVGVAFDINKVARGEIGVGYQNRDYENALFEDISGVNVDAALEYFPSDLTTLTLTAQRAIQNTATIGVAGYYTNGGDITIEHELFRRLILVGRAEYRRDDFRGIDRDDELLRFSGGGDYAFRRNIVLSVRYIYLDVSSSGTAARSGFEEQIIRVGIELRR